MPPISKDRFNDIVKRVQRRDAKEPFASAFSSDTDHDVIKSWDQLQSVFDSAISHMNSDIKYTIKDGKPDFSRRKFTHFNDDDVTDFERGAREGMFTPQLAVALGELNRIASLTDDELADPSMAVASTSLNKDVASLFVYEQTLKDKNRKSYTVKVDESNLQIIYPVLLGTSQAFRGLENRNRAHDPKADESMEPGMTGIDVVRGFPLAHSIPATRSLERLYKAMGRCSYDRRFSHLMFRGVPQTLSQSLFSVIPREEKFIALQRVWDLDWSLESKHSNCEGAVAGFLRDRVSREGSPALVSSMATSSDGDDRIAAAVSTHINHELYEHMTVTESALRVLRPLVENKLFTKDLAINVMEQGSTASRVAIMLYATSLPVDIRTQCCYLLLQEAHASPYHIYLYLEQMHRNPEVPESLWGKFGDMVNVRLRQMKILGNERMTKQFQQEVERFSRDFYNHFLQGKELDDLIKNFDDVSLVPEESEEGKILREARDFVGGHHAITNPAVLEAMLAGVTTDEQKIKLLKVYRFLKIPVREEVFNWAMQQDSIAVRNEGGRLLDQVEPESAQERQERHSRRLQWEMQAVEDAAKNTATELYTEMDDDVEHDRRRRNDRPNKGQRFMAAGYAGVAFTQLLLQSIKTGQRNYLNSKATSLARYAKRMSGEEALELVNKPYEEDFVGGDFFRKRVEQGILFDEKDITVGKRRKNKKI